MRSRDYAAFGTGGSFPKDLLNIRGAMWTARAPIPYGPRPGQPDNILAMDYYEVYGAMDRKLMLDIYCGQHGYTHAATGPLVDPGGYHGQYPATPDAPTQASFDAYLDGLQEWKNRGLAPIHFCKPDGWSLQQLIDQLEPFYLQPRAQALLPLVVPGGWEPAIDTDNATWVSWLEWGARVFPNAIRLIHMVADHDAPQWDAGMDNSTAWANVTPYIHGWLVQNAGYAVNGGPIASPQFVSDFTGQFNVADDGSLKARFVRGTHGWPTTSANGGPLKVYAGEFAAYGDYWNNYPESEAIRLGDVARAAGADGSFDGCTS